MDKEKIIEDAILAIEKLTDKICSLSPENDQVIYSLRHLNIIKRAFLLELIDSIENSNISIDKMINKTNHDLDKLAQKTIEELS